MWTLAVLLSASAAPGVDVSGTSTVHVASRGQHQLLVGTGVSVRPGRRFAVQVDLDLGLIGPRNRIMEGVSEPSVRDAGREPMDVETNGIVATAPRSARFRRPRITGAVATEAVVTPLILPMKRRWLALDIGAGLGVIRTADGPRPAPGTWSEVDPDPLRVQWQLAPAASIGARLGLSERVSLQLQARGRTWTEEWEGGSQSRELPVWATGGMRIHL